MMSTRTWGFIIVAILVSVALFVGFTIFMEAPRDTAVSPSPATSTSVRVTPATDQQPPSTQALSERVTVTSPVKGAHVGHSIVVAGLAPGPWFFEAQFPMMVRTADGDVVGRATATAQGEWMTEKSVVFTATMQIDATYHGKATLALLKDNPSGLPENDDSVEIPIVVD